MEEIQLPKGVKWTKQRKSVYDVLYKASEPLNATQIYNRVCESGQDMSFAMSTVYRILSSFEEKSLINKITWMDSETFYYELNKGGHTHYAVCLKCHKRIPLETCPIVKLPGVARDFTVTGHKLELYGYCKDCEL